MAPRRSAQSEAGEILKQMIARDVIDSDVHPGSSAEKEQMACPHDPCSAIPESTQSSSTQIPAPKKNNDKNKKEEASPKKTASVCNNPVDGVIQNYLDQLLIDSMLLTDISTKIAPPISVIETEQKEAQLWVPNSLEKSTQKKSVPEKESSLFENQLQVGTKTSILENEQPITELLQHTPSHDELIDKDFPELHWQKKCGVDCLYFSLANLKLVVPLAHLSRVFKLYKPLVSVVKSSGLRIGSFQLPYFESDISENRARRLPVIDGTNLFTVSQSTIRPPSHSSDSSQGRSQIHCPYLIHFSQQDWLISCDDIYDVLNLHDADIRWRHKNNKQPWLAGTVVSKLCTVIDVEQFIDFINHRLKG